MRLASVCLGVGRMDGREELGLETERHLDRCDILIILMRLFIA
jgi:hypothetical protein